jgi:hypothetical protein
VESLDQAAWEIFTRDVGRPNLVHAANREHALTKSGAKPSFTSVRRMNAISNTRKAFSSWRF